MADLRVELYGTLVGHLTKINSEVFDFRTDPEAFPQFQLGSTVVSESVPLLPVQKSRGRSRRQNYFSELLPEGRILENLAASIGASENDVITILTHFGRDIAGAIQIYDPDQPGEPRIPKSMKLTQEEVSQLLEDTKRSPLGNRPRLGKTSLAGVQDKIVLAKLNGDWHQVVDGYPSTHIVKPNSKEYPTIIFDEEYGSRIAWALGLAEYRTWLENFSGTTGLVIERYDRTSDIPPRRIHQEDMNQALGARKNQKYQEYGGKVSLLRISDVFGKIGDRDSLVRLLKLNTLAVAIGNLDLHAKNISILHLSNEGSLMAPAYDTVPLVHNPGSDGKMALAVNGKYKHSQISSADILAEANSWGLKGSAEIVNDTLEIIKSFVMSESPDARAYERLSQDIALYTQNLLDGKSTMST